MQRKNLTLIVLLALLPLLTFGQNLSFTLDVGYGFELNPMSINDGDITAIEESPNSATFHFETIRHSFGEGLNYGGFLEYAMNKNFEIGVGISYLEGKKEDRNIIDYNGDERIDLMYGRMLRIIPEMKLNIPMKKNVVFARLGLLMGFNAKVIEDTNSNDPENWSRSVKSGGNSFGYLSGLGYKIALTKNIKIAPELRVYSQTFGPKRYEVTSMIVEGEEIVESLEPRRRYGNYEDEYDKIYTGGGVNMDEPWTERRVFLPFSSIGFNLNLVYEIGTH